MRIKLIFLATIVCFFISGIQGSEDPSKQSEFSLYYSSWSWNLVKKPIEKKLGNLLENKIEDILLDKINNDFPGARVQTYNQIIQFDSGGNNFGFEARWYPGGRDTTFSLGFAFEKSTWRIGLPLVSVHMEVVSDLRPSETGIIEGKVENVLLRIEPISFNFKMQWDWWPYWRVHPYGSIGVGFFSIRSFEEGRFTLKYRADMGLPQIPAKHYEDEYKETAREFIDESSKEGSEIKLPSIIPILELHLGIRWKITNFLSVLLDGGFYDGFMLRGGITYRI